MTQIPDAPWIREAEMYGYPEPKPVKCPVCGEECETIYMDFDRNVFGCDECILKKDAWDWMADELDASRPEDDDPDWTEDIRDDDDR